ncbi:hypothetical protein BH09PSE3_BH09PSE3_19540 [soil metagenome]
MWATRWRKTKTKMDARLKVLLWAAFIGLFFSVTDLGEPLENQIHIWRDSLHPSKASGKIVVVGVDDKSLKEVGFWPWPRQKFARLIDNLNADGARRILLDINFVGSTNPVDDQALEDAIKRAGTKIVLPTRFQFDYVTGKRTLSIPNARFLQNAHLANINVWFNFAGQIWKMPFGLRNDGVDYRSMASVLAGVNGPIESFFPIDTSISYKSIRTISASDVFNGTVNPEFVKDKDVIIGVTSQQLNDIYRAPGQDLISGVYSHVLAAETLIKRASLSIDPLITWGAILSVCVVLLYARNRYLKLLCAGFTVTGLMLAPVFLDYKLIFVNVVPGFVMLVIVVIGLARIRIKLNGASTNAHSGLPNLNALRQASAPSGVSLTIARIRNFPEISSSLDPAMERLLVEQIVDRFGLGIGGSILYQGEEGIFAWFAQEMHGSEIGDQLSGLHALLTAPVVIANRKIDLAVTFGVDASDDRSLANRIGSALVAADEASAEGLKWKGYDRAKLKEADWKLSLLGRLDEAIDNGEIWVAYQPKMDIASRQIVGAEALVRWSHPEKGEISPDEFIPVAEQHGRIEKLTLYVLDNAIRTAVALNARRIDFHVAVNLSARLLQNPYLASTISDHLSDLGLDPGLLTLEVTESAAIADGGNSVALLHELREAGICISIDDYGTGFSTLEYFRKIPANEIKIDKSFVSLIDRNNSDRLMVNSTIQLAHQLDRKVVAEGVETVDTLNALAAMGCDQAQGYLIGRPMRFAALGKLLLRQRQSSAA